MSALSAGDRQTVRSAALDAEAALATLLARALLWPSDERALRDALDVIRQVASR